MELRPADQPCTPPDRRLVRYSCSWNVSSLLRISLCFRISSLNRAGDAAQRGKWGFSEARHVEPQACEYLALPSTDGTQSRRSFLCGPWLMVNSSPWHGFVSSPCRVFRRAVSRNGRGGEGTDYACVFVASAVCSSIHSLSSVWQVDTDVMWRNIWLDLTIIVAVAVCSGLAVNEIRAHGVPILPPSAEGGHYREMDLSAVRSELARNPRVVIFDARPHELYQKNHVAGALNFPVSQFDFFYDYYLGDAPSDTPIFVCGRTFSRALDQELAYRLSQKGHKNVTLLN